ncbi:hypothetical protein ACTXT7_012867 [Hymenolepis weldensis]
MNGGVHDASEANQGTSRTLEHSENCECVTDPVANKPGVRAEASQPIIVPYPCSVAHHIQHKQQEEDAEGRMPLRSARKGERKKRRRTKGRKFDTSFEGDEKQEFLDEEGSDASKVRETNVELSPSKSRHNLARQTASAHDRLRSTHIRRLPARYKDYDIEFIGSNNESPSPRATA